MNNQLNSGYSGNFDPSEWIRTACRAFQVNQNDTKMAIIPWDFQAEKSFFKLSRGRSRRWTYTHVIRYKIFTPALIVSIEYRASDRP